MRTDVKIGIAVGLVLVVGVVVYMVINSGSSDSPEGDQPIGLSDSRGNDGSDTSGGLGSGNPDGSLADSLFPRDPADLLTPGGGGDPAKGDPAIGDPAIGDPAIGDPAIGDPAIGDPAIGDPGTVTDPAPGSVEITMVSPGPVDPGPADPSLVPGGGDSPVGPLDPGSPRIIPDPTGVSTVAPVIGTARTHVIKSGEKLWNLAEMYYGHGKHWPLLLEANPGLNPTAMVVGRTIKIPPPPTSLTGGGAPGAATPDPVTAAGEKIYVVRQGDNGMWGISKSQYGDGKYLPAIAGRNPGVSSSQLKIGQKIILPSLEQAKAFLAGSSRSGGSGVVTPDPITATGEKIYVVKQGDNGMWGISKSQYGDGKYLPAIAGRNPGVSPSRLKIGQKLILPSLEQAKAFLAGSSAGAPVSSGGTSVPTPVRTPRPVSPPATAGDDDEPDFS